MAYNYGLEFKKFEARQRILRLQYEQFGMPEFRLANTLPLPPGHT